MVIIQLSGTRTGSTFFYRCLDSHPDIEANPEMYRIDSNRRSDHLINPMYGGDKIITFKLMYNHCKHFNLLEKIIEMNIPIIHVMRAKTYRKVLSDLVSNIMNGDSSYIDPDRFKRLVEDYSNQKMFYDSRLKHLRKYTKFFMEDFIEPDSTMNQDQANRLCDFLGVERRKLMSDSKKLTPHKDHWDYIENAEELKKLV